MRRDPRALTLFAKGAGELKVINSHEMNPKKRIWC
jgi:hypothetical protein